MLGFGTKISDDDQKIYSLTTDYTDFTDVNHKRKRDYPFYLCNLCSKKGSRFI